MKIKCIVVALLVLLIYSQPVTAEFYRYKDQHGNVLYTDDLSKIPADQREKAKAYEAAQSSDDETAQPEATPTEDAKAIKETDERQMLKQQEEALNKEYEGLIKERNALDEEKKSAVTPDQIKEYNQKIVDFNTRIQAYEEKRAAYAEKVDAYNAKLKVEKDQEKKSRSE